MRRKADFRLYQKPKSTTFTKEGLDQMKDTYQKLKDERPDAVMHLKKAREMGDLSENGYYKASRQRLSYIDSQLLRLGTLIKHAVVSEVTQTDTVQVGSKVTLVTDGKKVVYTIVGRMEANPTEGKISEVSPLGRAVLGKKIGDTISIETPSATVTYTLTHIS